MAPSAFDDLVDSVRAALNAKRSEVAERIATLESALRGYERALEFEIAEAFATEHELKQPARQIRAPPRLIPIRHRSAKRRRQPRRERTPASW